MTTKVKTFAAALGLTLLMAGARVAVQPEEVLEDPVLEEGGRGTSEGLRDVGWDVGAAE